MRTPKLALSLLAAALTLPAVAIGAEPDGKDKPAEVQTVEAVDIKLQIKSGDKEVGQVAALLAWDQAGELSLDADGHRHVTSVTVRKDDAEGRTLNVQLGYQLDGKAILESLDVKAAAARKKVVKSEDGSIAIALTLAPKVVPVDRLSPPSDAHRIEFEPGDNDPLAGLD